MSAKNSSFLSFPGFTRANSSKWSCHSLSCVFLLFLSAFFFFFFLGGKWNRTGSNPLDLSAENTQDMTREKHAVAGERDGWRSECDLCLDVGVTRLMACRKLRGCVTGASRCIESLGSSACLKNGDEVCREERGRRLKTRIGSRSFGCGKSTRQVRAVPNGGRQSRFAVHGLGKSQSGQSECVAPIAGDLLIRAQRAENGRRAGHEASRWQAGPGGALSACAALPNL